MDNLMFAVSIVGVLLVIGGMIATAVWAVGQIKGESLAFRVQLAGLSSEVRQLSKSVSKLDDKLDDHSVRIARIEATRRNCTDQGSTP